MGDLERIEAKVDWCVSALKALLKAEVGAPESVGWAAEELMAGRDVDIVDDWIAPRHAPEPPKCTHQHQTLDPTGAVKCARCGFVLVQSGVVQDPARHGREALGTEWGQQSLRESNLNNA
jgi:hypothetical protein